MLLDLTIDTNVLVHAEDVRQLLRPAVLKLIKKILESDAHICVDEGFDLSPSRNASQIGHEYIKFLRFGGVGYNLVAHLASTGRVDPHLRRTHDGRDKVIRQLIPDKTDRVFLAVACNSSSHILYSHDIRHVNNRRTRPKAASDLNVRILNADQDY